MKKSIIGLICTVLLLSAVIGYAQDISRKIIHIKDYQPVPGDVYTLLVDYGTGVEGKQSLYTYNIPLQEDFSMEIPILGSIDAEGLNYSQLREQIINGLKNRLPVQYVDFSLRAPAIYDVFVYGAVNRPGMTTATSLTRLTELLALAGGTANGGSSRRIELIRGGESTRYDLRKYYAEGADEENPYIRPGDRIQVPQIEKAVTLEGAVGKSGSYEILEGEKLGDIISRAGGLTPAAQPEEITVIRFGEDSDSKIITVEREEIDTFPLSNGDLINIPSSRQTTNRVTVEGALYGKAIDKGEVQAIPETPVRITLPFQPGMTVKMVLEQLGGPTPFAETERSFLIRGKSGERMLIPDLEELWEADDASRDIVLKPGDYLVVPMKNLQIIVGGEVNAPDAYPYIRGLTVGDYLRSARGINPDTGSMDDIYLVDELGNREAAGLASMVDPGEMIYVGKNSWTLTQEFFTDLFIVTGWLTSIFGLTYAVLDFGNRLNLWNF